MQQKAENPEFLPGTWWLLAYPGAANTFVGLISTKYPGLVELPSSFYTSCKQVRAVRPLTKEEALALIEKEIDRLSSGVNAPRVNQSFLKTLLEFTGEFYALHSA